MNDWWETKVLELSTDELKKIADEIKQAI